MKTLVLTDKQFRVMLAALEVYVAQEQKLADEQELDATADQEVAEDMLDDFEGRLGLG